MATVPEGRSTVPALGLRRFKGTGKTHVVSALGHELVRQGRSVLFTPVSALVERLLEAKRDLRLNRELRRDRLHPGGELFRTATAACIYANAMILGLHLMGTSPREDPPIAARRSEMCVC